MWIQIEILLLISWNSNKLIYYSRRESWINWPAKETSFGVCMLCSRAKHTLTTYRQQLAKCSREFIRTCAVSWWKNIESRKCSLIFEVLPNIDFFPQSVLLLLFSALRVTSSMRQEQQKTTTKMLLVQSRHLIEIHVTSSDYLFPGLPTIFLDSFSSAAVLVS